MCSIGRILLGYANVGTARMIQNQISLSRFSRKKSRCSFVILLLFAVVEARNVFVSARSVRPEPHVYQVFWVA